MNAKIWIILCLAFGAYNLKQLFDEYYSLNYMIVEEDGHLYDKHTNYMVCTPFKEIGANNELKFRPPVLRNVTPAVLLNYSILSVEEKLKHRNLFKLNESFISRENPLHPQLSADFVHVLRYNETVFLRVHLL